MTTGGERPRSALARIAWLVVAVVGGLAITWLLGISGPAALAVGQDGLPVWLVVAWPVLVFAAFTRRGVLATCALALGVLQVAIVAGSMIGDEVPSWVDGAPRLRVVVANVFIENDDPAAAAQAVLAVDADVIVIVESNPAFLAAFDEAGGAARFPARVTGGVPPDYLVTVASALPIDPDTVGEEQTLFAPQAVIRCGTDQLELVGVNPAAAVDPGGYEQWQRQLAGLEEVAAGSAGPLVIAGDLNTTQFRPDFEQLLESGLRDAHSAVGEGLDASFKLAADGPLSSLGTVARLDRLLFNDRVWPVELTDLEVPGSDHEGFVAQLAVRADGPCR